MAELKFDAARFEAAVDALRAAPWLTSWQKDWPNHLYHFTDVQNAASILRHGMILSRRSAIDRGLLVVDSADSEVIDQTTWAHKYARLYFGPKTPTQFRNEGIKPPENRIHGAHCPVPVFFIFSSRRVLTRADCRITGGNPQSGDCYVLERAEAFERLPFRDIYHRDPIKDGRNREVTFRRCAEVLIPEALDFEALEEVVCRTAAERETLLYLLGDRELAKGWKGRIRVERVGEGLFENRGLAVSDILLDEGAIYVQLNRAAGGLRRQLIVRYPDGSVTRVAENAAVGSVYQYLLPTPTPWLDAKFLLIDDCLAFKGRLRGDLADLY